jgi:protein gp37
MSDGTKIEWTDATWNVITGCSVVSPGCKNCYAMKLAGTRLRHHPSRIGLTQPSAAGPVWTGEVRFNEQWLGQPLSWNRPRRIFVCAHGDLFHEGVTDVQLDDVFAVMAEANWHTFQVLTKRMERARSYLSDPGLPARIERAAVDAFNAWRIPRVLDDRAATWPLPNVWIGTSIEDQARANGRVPHLLATPAAVRWVSAEPLLGSVKLDKIEPARSEHHGSLRQINETIEINALAGTSLTDMGIEYGGAPRIDWVVVGGESGNAARPMNPDWARSLRDQCAANGVAFHFKQWGEWGEGDSIEATGLARHGWWEDDAADGGASRQEWAGPVINGVELASQRPEVFRVGKKAAGRTLDGRTHDGWPGEP